MDNIYALSDTLILQQIGNHLRDLRLRQNITQQVLADHTGVSLSSIKKNEKGDIGSFESLLRLLRTLGELDVLSPLVEERQLSPNEYFELVQKANQQRRKRASGKAGHTVKEESEW